MAWKQKRGSLPYQEWQDIDLTKTYPDLLWKQKSGDLPYKEWQDINLEKTYPDLLWLQKRGYMPYKGWAKFPIIVKEELSGISEFEIIIYDEPQTIVIDDISYTNLNGLKKHRENVSNDISNLNNMISSIPITKTTEEYADEYNAIVNGNVDCRQRNWFVTDTQMWERGWSDFPAGEKTSVYKQRFTFKNSTGEDHYVIDITPIIGQDSIYTPLQLSIYTEVIRIICEKDGTIEDILDEDFKNLIVHIYDGIPEYDENGKTEIDRQLESIENEHMILVELDYNKDVLERTTSEIEMLENGRYAERKHTLIIEEEW